MVPAALGSLPEGEAIEDGLDDEHQLPEDEELRGAAVERDVRESQRSFKHVIKNPGKGHVVVDTRQLGYDLLTLWQMYVVAHSVASYYRTMRANPAPFECLACSEQADLGDFCLV